MNILVALVEDDDAKALRVTELLMRQRAKVQRLKTAAEVRGWLSNNRPDLLILDVVIPNRADSAPDVVTGIDLLREIADGGYLLRPRYTIGLTEHREVAQEFAAEFEELLWTLVVYDVATNAWSNSLLRMMEHICAVDEQSRSAGNGCDVCILTGLRDPELLAILDLPWKWRPPEPIDRQTFTYGGTLDVAGNSIEVVAASAPRMGCVASALLAQRMLERFRPRMLLMTGLCAGITGRVSLGDIVVASASWDWQSGKHAIVDGVSEFDVDPDQLQCSAQLSSRIELLSPTELAQVAGVCTHVTPAGWAPRLHVGPMASGSAVLANEAILKTVMRQNRKVLAIDMECYGIYAAAARYSLPVPLFATIKAVSDYGDQNKATSEIYRRAFAFLSAQVAAWLVSSIASDLRST